MFDSGATEFFGTLAGDLREIGKTWAISEINGDGPRQSTQPGESPTSPAGQPAPSASATSQVEPGQDPRNINLFGLEVNRTAATVAGLALATAAVIWIVR